MQNNLKTKKHLGEHQWYIITVVSGNEDSVIKNLWGKIEAYGLSDLVQDIKVIKETVVSEEIFSELDMPSNYGRKMKDVTWETIKEANGKSKFKKIKRSEVNRFFGYIFIKMIMTDDAWFIIRNTQMITGIIGSSGKSAKPIPVGDDEIGLILAASEDAEQALELQKTGKAVVTKGDAIIITHNFHVGQTVRIMNGQFKGEKGTISTLKDVQAKMLVVLNLFGRETETEINYDDVELDA